MDQRVQNLLFIFACTNSVMDPIVYGFFNLRKSTAGGGAGNRGGRGGGGGGGGGGGLQLQVGIILVQVYADFLLVYLVLSLVHCRDLSVAELTK